LSQLGGYLVKSRQCIVKEVLVTFAKVTGRLVIAIYDNPVFKAPASAYTEMSAY
jgi:hypothetical protein